MASRPFAARLMSAALAAVDVRWFDVLPRRRGETGLLDVGWFRFDIATIEWID